MIRFGGRPWQRMVRDVVARDRVCWSCGRKAQTADHIIPRSVGGENTLANLRGACHACNRRRGAKSVGQFLEEQRQAVPTIFGVRRSPIRGDYSRRPAGLRKDYTT